MSNPYDRIEIVVAGMEELTARPTQFEYDGEGNVKAIAFETTCPACGGVINFLPEHIMKRGGKDHIGCLNCQVDRFDEHEEKKIISVTIGGQKMETKNIQPNKKLPIVTCPFVDPIDKGVFNASDLDKFSYIKVD